MSSAVARHREIDKPRSSAIGNPNSRIRNRISPVMQKVKSLLPPSKAAQTLSYLTETPLSTCQKLLCGERAESAEMLVRLLCTEEFGIGQAVLLTIGEGRSVKYIEAVRRRANVAVLKKQIAAAQRLIADAMQVEE